VAARLTEETPGIEFDLPAGGFFSGARVLRGTFSLFLSSRAGAFLMAPIDGVLLSIGAECI
jgi:hypothetical protein